MNKIADADELEGELRRLVAYAQSAQPSRSRIAGELRALSARLADHGYERQASFGSDNKAKLTELKKHLDAGQESATKAQAVIKELETAAKGNKTLESKLDSYANDVRTTAINFKAISHSLARFEDY